MSKRKITGGYCGFHNNSYLRSSYEYVYCRILEEQGISYKVEEKVYDLGYRKYIPDFTLYNSKGEIFKLVEIKSSRAAELKRAKEAQAKMMKLFNLECDIFQYKDLRNQCINLNLGFSELVKHWKSNSIGRNIMVNELNPMYGETHSESTLEKIGKSSLERWENPEFRAKLSKKRKDYFRNNKNRENLSNSKKKQYKKQREAQGIKEYRTLICEECHKSIIVRFNDRRTTFCSKSCATKHITKIANDVIREKHKKRHDEIRIDLYKHFLLPENNELLESKKRNLIYNQVKLILNKYDCKDIRIFKYIITGTYNSSFNDLYNEFMRQLNIYLKSMPNLQDDKL